MRSENYGFSRIFLAMDTPLKVERCKRNLSATDLAQAMGVTQPTINRIENGRKRPSPDLANRLAKFFDNAVTRDQILFPEDYPTRAKKPVRSERPQEGCDSHAGN